MAVAQGPNQRISGGGAQVNGRFARVYCWVKPLLVDATGAPLADPGTFDAAGQYLHVRYHGNLNLRARSGGLDPTALDFVPNKIVVDFDAQSQFTVPFEGYVELVGGKGQWLFGIDVLGYGDEADYEPEYRWLSTFRTRGTTFTIPDYHTYIMSADPTATVTLPTGNALVPGNLMPGQSIVSGLPVVLNNDNTLKTAWRG